jgi:formylglycine-generating enzyme required for sulfatase activity
MAELSDALFADLVAFITPHVREEDFRRAWLARPLRNQPAYNDVVWTGSARAFATHIIELLPHDLLGDAIGELGELRGEAVGREAVRLRERIAPEAPRKAEYADPVQAYCARVLADPSLRRFRIDERFVRLRVLLDRGSDAEAGRWADSGIEAGDLPELLAKLRKQAPAEVVVVLGAPGAGKSVLLRHLQTSVAQERLDDPRGPIPFFVALNDYRADAPVPLEWLRQRWRDDVRELPPFDNARRQGRILLMADALNEMGHTGDLGARIALWREMLPDFVKDGNRAAFTCRAIDIGGGLSSPELTVPQAEVQPLAPPQIHDFLKHYVPQHADAVFARIDADERQRTLYGTPFFLALLVQQISPGGDLPASRAALFAGFIRAAIQREITARHPLFVEDGAQALVHKRDRDWLGQPRGARPQHDLPAHGPLIGRLSALAYGMQRDAGKVGARREQQVRVREHTALRLLDHPRAREILDAAMRLNLIDELLGPGSVDVQYSHQLFQEFFAARVVAEQPAPELAAAPWRANEITPGVRELLSTLGKGERLPELPTTGWEETAQVAAAMTPDADAFVRGLMGPNLALAGRCAAAPGVRVSEPLKAELRWALVKRSRDPAADLRARIDAALALGPLGDPRFERKAGPHGAYLLPSMVAIPAGTYRIGDGESSESHEKPEIDVSLAAFEIGQFAVTNAEFGLFMQAGGYDDERWWETDAAKAWRDGSGSAEGLRQVWRDNYDIFRSWRDDHIPTLVEVGRISQENADEWTRIRKMGKDELERNLTSWFPEGKRYTEPRFLDDSAFNAFLQPVVGICWHEARAYGAWLSAQAGCEYRLPTEYEWEAAARGRERRTYAYRGEFDATKGNTFETRLKRTTPVGVFPEGDSLEGLADMTGNTWDWTLSPYTDQHDASKSLDLENAEARRVLRGGSWFNAQLFARAACRNRLSPYDRANNFGFRVLRPA